MRNLERLVPLAAALLIACGGDDDDDNPVGSGGGGGGETIEIPTAYVFDSRFTEGESSVAYSGQVVRNLLLQDLKIFIDNLGKDGASSASVQDMLDLYAYDDGYDLESLTTAGSMPVVESRYSSISTGKNLNGKISGDVVIGYGKTADELVRGWFEIIAGNSQDGDKLGTPAVYTDENGVDLTQMINKVLIGAVPYYQATGVYLAGLLDRGNGEPHSEGKAYSSMEHGWDEAFGYFGAARDYARYTDEQLAGSVGDYTFDSNGDGSIDFNSEYNFGLSRNAGKRDKGGAGVDFTGDIFAAFLAGRTLIVNQGSAGRNLRPARSSGQRHGEGHRGNGGALHQRHPGRHGGPGNGGREPRQPQQALGGDEGVHRRPSVQSLRPDQPQPVGGAARHHGAGALVRCPGIGRVRRDRAQLRARQGDLPGSLRFLRRQHGQLVRGRFLKQPLPSGARLRTRRSGSVPTAAFLCLPGNMDPVRQPAVPGPLP